MSHPHLSHDGYYLSETEIQHWLQVLLEQPEYGICNVEGGPAALAREMGVRYVSTLKGKYQRGSWIYPGEQRRMTRVIQQVRKGEIRLRKRDARHCDFYPCDPAVPPVKPHLQARWRFSAGGRLERVPEPESRPLMPGLSGLFDRARKWK